MIISHKVVYIFLQNGGNIDFYFICIETYHTIPRVLRTLTEVSNVTCCHFQLGSHSFYQPKASYIDSRVLSTLIEASKVTWYHFQLGSLLSTNLKQAILTQEKQPPKIPCNFICPNISPRGSICHKYFFRDVMEIDPYKSPNSCPLYSIIRE